MIEVHRILLEIHRILLANICIQNGTAKTADHFSLFRSILRSVERTEKLYVISGAAKKCINTSSDQELEIMWLYRVRGEGSEGERRGLGTERQTNKQNFMFRRIKSVAGIGNTLRRCIFVVAQKLNVCRIRAPATHVFVCAPFVCICSKSVSLNHTFHWYV